MSDPAASPTDDRLEDFVIDDVETLKAVADPMRMRILFELDDPRTVKELASVFDVPQTRLYYHVKILERAGLIRVVSRRTVSGIEERTYRCTAKSTTISPRLGSELAGSGAVKALLDMLATQIGIALQDPAPVGEPDSSVLVLNMTKLFLSPDESIAFRDQLFSIAAQYNEDGPGKTQYEAFVAVHRNGGRPGAP